MQSAVVACVWHVSVVLCRSGGGTSSSTHMTLEVEPAASSRRGDRCNVWLYVARVLRRSGVPLCVGLFSMDYIRKNKKVPRARAPHSRGAASAVRVRYMGGPR